MSYSPEEVQHLLSIFKTGSLENIELALQLAQDTSIELCLPQFEELFAFLIKVQTFPTKTYSTAEKIYHILNAEEISILIEKEEDAVISANLFLFKNLKKLSIGAAVKVWIPHTITFFEQLEELELYLLNQNQLPKHIFDITSLKKLDLSLNLLEELPREIWQLRNLEFLNMCYCCNLHTLPNELFSLPKLKQVHLLHTAVQNYHPLLAYSAIEEYYVEVNEYSLYILGNYQLAKKLLKHSGKKQNTLFSQRFWDWHLSPNSSIKSNVPLSIQKQGIEAIKGYLKTQ